MLRFLALTQFICLMQRRSGEGVAFELRHWIPLVRVCSSVTQLGVTYCSGPHLSSLLGNTTANVIQEIKYPQWALHLCVYKLNVIFTPIEVPPRLGPFPEHLI